MQIIDKRGKLFGLLNLLDLLIVILIIAAGLFGYKYVSGSAIDGQKADVHFTVELKSVNEDFAKKIQVDHEIKDSIKGYYLGIVENVEVRQDEVTNWDGVALKFIKTPVPESYTVLVKVKAQGTISKDNADIYAESVPVKVGKEMSIKGKGYASTGYIVELIVD